MTTEPAQSQLGTIHETWYTIIAHDLGGGPFSKYATAEEAQAEIDTWTHGGKVAYVQAVQGRNGTEFHYADA